MHEKDMDNSLHSIITRGPGAIADADPVMVPICTSTRKGTSTGTGTNLVSGNSYCTVRQYRMRDVIFLLVSCLGT